jgi:hypothetical protein
LWAATETGWLSLFPILRFSPMVFWAARQLATTGEHTLTLDKREVVVESGLGWRRREAMPLDELELVRVNHQLDPSLKLLSDGAIIHMSMDPDDADWLRS